MATSLHIGFSKKKVWCIHNTIHYTLKYIQEWKETIRLLATSSYFEPISGIDDNTDDDIVIYSLDGCIIVEGADGEPVTIYDMTGRIVRDCGLPNGVYMVKVGDRTPRKVVVAR